MELDSRHDDDLHEYQTSEIFKRLKLSLGPEEVKEFVVVEKKENHKSYIKKYLNKAQIETFKKQGLLSEGLEKEMMDFVSIESNILFIKNKLFLREHLDELIEKKYINTDLSNQLKAFYKLLDQKADVEKKVKLLEEELREVFSDEKRLRENIKILSNENSSLKNNILKEMENGEKLIKKNRKEIKEKKKEIERLNEKIENLKKDINKMKDNQIEVYKKIRDTIEK